MPAEASEFQDHKYVQMIFLLTIHNWKEMGRHVQVHWKPVMHIDR